MDADDNDDESIVSPLRVGDTIRSSQHLNGSFALKRILRLVKSMYICVCVDVSKQYQQYFIQYYQRIPRANR